MRPYPEAPAYFVNERGEVFSSYGQLRKMPTRLDKYGYETVQVRINGRTNTRFVHRMVMWTYCGPSDLQVNHKDYNPKNNFLENLEYCTAEENIRHACLRRPKKPQPPKKSRHRDDREFIELLISLKGSLTAREVAELFGLKKTFVNKAWEGRARPWQHQYHITRKYKVLARKRKGVKSE